MHENTSDLLDELEVIDRREDGILDVLLARGERLERGRAVTVGDLESLGGGLAGLEGAIAELRRLIARADEARRNGDTIAALAASLRANDAEADRLRGELRERLGALAPAPAAARNGAAHHAPPPVHHGAAHHAPAPPVHHRGARYEHEIAHAARLSRLPVSLVCAVIEQESGFRNVFGHDRVANPIKSPPGGVLEVTKERYEAYLHHRHRGLGNQGVGPMQLTNSAIQDRADALGGCWRPGPNIRAGCELLADNIRRLGLRDGVQAYNGAAGHAYADAVLALQRKWKAAPAGYGHGGPRTLRLTHPAMVGDDVRDFQRALNRRLDALGIDEHVSEDGDFGPETRHAARQAAYALGVASSAWAHGITPDVQALIRTPSRRTPQQLAAARRRRGWVARLRKRQSGPLRMRAFKEAKRLLDMHVREAGGNNHGPMVARIILANRGAVGEPWCGDFVAWCYRKAGSKSVTRAWAAVNSYLPLAGLKRVAEPLKGDAVRYTFGHIGLFGGWCDAHGRTVARRHATHLRAIEGNTGRAGAVSDSAGGGDGVYLKIRSRALVRDFVRVTR
jgi:hypothetical protein